MGNLHRLHDEQGQSPWLDNIRRDWLRSGEIARWIGRGVRGITSNPSIFEKAVAQGHAYDEQLTELSAAGKDIDEIYWDVVISDIVDALDLFEGVHRESDGVDGFVSIEVSPLLANDTGATVDQARHLWKTINRSNLYVKIPATAEGVPAIRTMVAEMANINVTLMFSLDRYVDVMEAYVAGLEDAVAAGAEDLSGIVSVASFFISRVDTEVDKRLEAIGTPEALALRGQAAVAQGQLAYELFTEKFTGPRWDALVAKGARPQRPLWASTSTKNPAYPDTLYVDTLIGPNTVNTLPEATLEAFEDHGTLARTVDADIEGAHTRWAQIGELVDLADVARVLEEQGVAAFKKSFHEMIDAFEEKISHL